MDRATSCVGHMIDLEDFHKAHGPGKPYAHPSAATLKNWGAKVPETLRGEWEQRGFCSYADGLLWTVAPDDFAPCIKEWLPEWNVDSTFVFVRSALGDLLISHDGTAGQLNVHYGRYVDLVGDVELFMDHGLDEKYRDTALDGRLARKAMEKFGAIAPDEMFTFEPALAIGGARDLKHVKKVKMMPQLSFLAQLYDHITIE